MKLHFTKSPWQEVFFTRAVTLKNGETTKKHAHTLARCMVTSNASISA